MSDHTLRGSIIGNRSLESDENIDPVDREEVAYICPKGHETIIPFAVTAEIPEAWECRCGAVARREDVDDRYFYGGYKPKRTHWDLLLERRTEEELQEVLEKRLKMHREGWIPDYE